MASNVLVMVKDGLLRADVIETAQEVLGEAQIHIADDAEMACSTLAQHEGWAWAVVDLPEESLRQPEIAEAFVAYKAQPVVLRDALDDPQMASWVFLDPPFDTQMLRDALERTRPA